jgi:hypothetical protein
MRRLYRLQSLWFIYEMPKVDCITLLHLFSWWNRRGLLCCRIAGQQERVVGQSICILRNIIHFEICGTIRRSAPVRCSLDRCCRNYVAPVLYIPDGPTSTVQHHSLYVIQCLLYVSMSILSLCGCERNEQRRAAKSRRDYRSCHFAIYTLFLYVCCGLLPDCVCCCAGLQRESEEEGNKKLMAWQFAQSFSPLCDAQDSIHH